MAFSQERRDLSFALLDRFVELGGNIVDTAHIYGGGQSERVLGQWLSQRRQGTDVVVVSKGAHHNADRKRVSPEDITCDLRDSLARLQCASIGLYMLHRDDPDVPAATIIEALDEHQRAGRIAAFGASNWTTARLEEANAHAESAGLSGFCSSSVHLSLAAPNEPVWTGCVDAHDAASRDWYRRNRMPLFAWSSQARGFFSGRCTPEGREDETLARVYYSGRNWERLRRAQDLGVKKGGYTATQIALAWLLNQPLETYALIGPQTIEELESCAAASRLPLSPEEVEWLEAA